MTVNQFRVNRDEFVIGGHLHLNAMKVFQQTLVTSLILFRPVQGQQIDEIVEMMPTAVVQRVETARVKLLTNPFDDRLFLVLVNLKNELYPQASRTMNLQTLDK